MESVIQHRRGIAAHEDDLSGFLEYGIVQQIRAVQICQRADGHQRNLTGPGIDCVCDESGCFRSGIFTGFRTPKQRDICPADLT